MTTIINIFLSCIFITYCICAFVYWTLHPAYMDSKIKLIVLAGVVVITTLLTLLSAVIEKRKKD